VLHSRVGSWPHPQKLDEVERLARDKHYSILQKSVNYGQKSFITLSIIFERFGAFMLDQVSLTIALAAVPDNDTLTTFLLNNEILKNWL
jgi:hypothetical protein